MPGQRRFRWLVKWMTTGASLLLFAAIAYSSRRAIDWHNSDVSTGVVLGHGAITFGWRIADWTPEQARYKPKPGWGEDGEFVGPARIIWLPSRSSAIRPWESVTIPLWPFWLVASAVAVLLWYRNRNAVWFALQRFASRFRPRVRLRLTVLRVSCACFVHFFILSVAVFIESALFIFFVPPEMHTRGIAALYLAAVGVLQAVFLFGTPAWGFLWAWAYVKWRNWLLLSQPALGCVTCGYDLTGNVTGVCPECGQALLPVQLSQVSSTESDGTRR